MQQDKIKFDVMTFLSIRESMNDEDEECDEKSTQEFDVSNEIENMYQKTMKMIVNRPELEMFSHEFSAVHRALLKSYTSEERLHLKCTQQQALVTVGECKLRTFNILTEGSPLECQELNEKLQEMSVTMWKVVQNAEATEVATRELVVKLEIDIQKLNLHIVEMENLGTGSKGYLKALQKYNHMVDQKNAILAENNLLRSEIARFTASFESIEENRVISIQNAKYEIQTDVSKSQEAANTCFIAMEAMKQVYETEKNELNRKREEIECMKTRIAQLNEDIGNKDNIDELRGVTLEAMHLHSKAIENKLVGAKQMLQHQLHLNAAIKELTKSKTEDCKIRKIEVQRIETDNEKLKKANDVLRHKKLHQEAAKLKLDAEKANLAIKEEMFIKLLNSLKNLREEEKKQFGSLLKDGSLLLKHLKDEKMRSAYRAHFVAMQKETQHRLKSIIASHKAEKIKLIPLIQNLDKEQTQFSDAVTEQMKKVLEFEENLEQGEIEIQALSEKRIQIDNKLRQQQRLYDIIKADKIMSGKGLIELKGEMQDIKQLTKIWHIMMDQLHSQISSGENSILQLIMERNAVEQETDEIAIRIKDLAEDSKLKNILTTAIAEEEMHLFKMLSRLQFDRTSTRKAMMENVRTNDNIRMVMMKRQLELFHLYSEYKVQLAILGRDEYEYACFLASRNQMLREFRSKCRTRRGLETWLKDLPDLKRATLIAERCQHKIICRTKQLMDDLSRPINVHRWRKKEFNYYPNWREMKYVPHINSLDSFVYETMQRIQLMKHRLVNYKTREVKLQAKMVEKQTTYVKAKLLRATHPGPELGEQIIHFRSAIIAKSKEYGAMLGTLKEMENQVKEDREEVNSLNRTIKKLIEEYFAEQRLRLEKIINSRFNFKDGVHSMADVNSIASSPEPGLRPDNIFVFERLSHCAQ